MRNYSITTSDTNTANTTQLGVTGSATNRPIIMYLSIGSVATPADNAGEWFLQRYTAAGTSTAYTPVKLDPGGIAANATAGVNHSAEPTYTANDIPLRIACNMRAGHQWYARDESWGIGLAASANNGVGLLANAVGGSAVAQSYTLHFGE